ncbi:MAG: hypothetical protein Q4B73_00985 [Lachnospiraceae bacterium]|nr:hypothetical protein [Lachnospiraceae bacterium]
MTNPKDAFKIMSLFNQFKGRHPKIVRFMTQELMGGVPEGTIFEISMTRPGEDTISTNMKVTAEDIELLQELKNLR